ncbi:MAG: ATP-binding protein [candidate division WOR-3 bacterium]
MERYLQKFILKDLNKKMVILTGPRQVGKTYLAKEILKNFQKSTYLNFDDIKDKKIILNKEWALDTEFIVLDEIQKLEKWKTFLKGIYDTKEKRQKILITGSAKLDIFKQTGDSLAGRYYLYHLFPFSVKELQHILKPYDAVEKLNRFGGFPEPFLSDSETESQRWRKEYYSDIITTDVLDFAKILEIRSIKTLLYLLKVRVGSPISYSSLAQDLQISVNTVKKYISILEALNIIFLIRPFHKNISRSILKEPKVYFFDTGFIDKDDGLKLENTVAVSLLKHCQFLQDSEGKDVQLHYIRTKEKKEIDFVITENNKIVQLIEVKLSDDNPDRNLLYFKKLFPQLEYVQLVHNLKYELKKDGIKIIPAGEYLSSLAV